MRAKPKKRLGQNFLVNRAMQQRIVAACGLAGCEQVVEIGPGRGELTRFLADQAAKIWAVEYDRDLAISLAQEFADKPWVRIIQADIRRWDLAAVLEQSGKVVVVGNIPYYISTPILEFLVANRQYISKAVLTVQKEFAARMCALPVSKKVYGSLSCFVQYYFQPRIVCAIRKTSFFPIPKVDSALVSLTVRECAPVRVDDPEQLFFLIRSAFSQRRKMLRNTLKAHVSGEQMNEFLQKNALSPQARPENISLAQFASLAQIISCKK